jgi:2-aminoadipate transaminase
MGAEIEVPVIVDLMSRALANPDLLSLAAGFTDNATLPNELVGQLAAEIAQDASHAALQYGQNQGRLRLRELACLNVSRHPGENAGRFAAERAMITNGSQQALYLAAQTLCDPGDIVLVQEPSYFVCLEMLKGLGIRPVGIPCDPSGVILEEGFAAKLAELEQAGERERIKAVYLVSFFCNPSSRSLDLEEKLGVASVLNSAGLIVPVIEDAAYRELYFEAPHPIPSIVSLPAFDQFPLLYLGTFTKPFATGLKIGFGYCTHPGWLEKMLCIKGHQDFGSAHFNQCLIERALESTHYAEHLQQARAHYAAKARVMEAALLEGRLQEHGWAWHRPEGGLIYWLRGPAEADLRMGQPFCENCIRQGVLYVPGDLCFPSGAPWNCARLSFGALANEKLPEAVGRFANEARKLR